MRFAHAVALAAAVAAITSGCEKKRDQAPSAAPAGSRSAAAEQGSGKIVIGHVGSLTGPSATFGQSTDKGVKLALAEANRRGGLKGRPLEVRTLDDQGKPEEAASATTRLITEDHVAVVIGEVASRRSLAMAPIADSERTPMISSASTNPAVTKDASGATRPYVFRVCFIDPFQGTVMAKFAREALKLSQVAVLRDVRNDYSVGLADFFVAKFKELGGAIATDESYSEGDQDFKSQLTRIKNKAPQAIYVPGYYQDVAAIARQARELGMKQPLMGGDGWDSAQLYKIAKGALDGSYFSNHYSDQDPSPVIQEFVKKYEAAYGGEVPDTMAVLGYDAANVAMDAMGRAKDLSRAAIRDAIEQTKGYRAVSGVITIDADHNAVKSAVVLKIADNRAQYVATIAP